MLAKRMAFLVLVFWEIQLSIWSDGAPGAHFISIELHFGQFTSQVGRDLTLRWTTGLALFLKKKMNFQELENFISKVDFRLSSSNYSNSLLDIM